VRLCGSRSTIVHAPRAPDDPCVRRPDIARARTLLRWAPRIGREDGFARTVEWFREALRA
jgi:dTDP-glucose 4,6-dehydratase